jgi:hypothetical protein
MKPISRQNHRALDKDEVRVWTSSVFNVGEEALAGGVDEHVAP